MDEIDNMCRATIIVSANGQPREVQRGSTIADLLRAATVTPAHVVVQMDGIIVPRSEFAQTILKEGNVLEIVTLVGGG